MSEKLYHYLEADFRVDSRIDLFLSMVSLIGGAVILIVCFYVIVVVVWVGLRLSSLEIENVRSWAYWISGALLAVVFLESWRSQRRLFEVYSHEFSASGAGISAALYLMGVGWGPRGILPLSSSTSRNFVTFLADVLYSGPRLLRNSVRLLRRSRARASAELHESARALEMALEAEGRSSFREISDRIPGVHLYEVLEHLSWVRGVVLLRSEPMGIVLTAPLRSKLREHVGRE